MKSFERGLACLVAAALGCSAPPPDEDRTGSVLLVVAPSHVELDASSSVQFIALLNGTTDSSVSWSVSEGGAGGTITPQGGYTAPAMAGAFHVVASKGLESATAEVIVTVPTPIAVTIAVSPTLAGVAPGGTVQFRATVTGAVDPSVSWSCDVGSMDLNGVFTAPSVDGTAHVTATSRADPHATATATVAITTPPPEPVTISISPSTAVATPGQSVFFLAGVSAGQVGWSADGGTVDQSGNWQAPPASGTYHVTVQSLADPAKTATATVDVRSTVTISVAPTSVNVEVGFGRSLKATVGGSADTAVLWSVREGPVGGTIDGNGQYTTGNTQGTFHVVVTSHADQSKSATAVVAVEPNPRDLIDGGGTLLTASRTFIVWWGDASKFPADARTALEGLLRGLDGSSYLAISNEYMRGAKATTAFGGSLFDATAPPDSADGAVWSTVCRAIDANAIAVGPGDIFIVSTPFFPAADEGRECAWHSAGLCHGKLVSFAYVPNPAGSWCDGPRLECPASGLSAVTESMVESTSHEVMEAITDPDHGWQTSGGGEIADGCGNSVCGSFTTGIFPVQQLYSNAVHGCVSP